jgi:gamma-glutamylcyclotransferase (GGCT)/AIG2-like uncharacterized protein YtfP
MTLVFVYGTLKRGGSNHRFMEDQTLVGTASTAAGFALYDLGGYPGLVPAPGGTGAVSGEVWSVDEACLARLDELEGTAEGLYRRENVPLAGPFAASAVQAYVYLKGTEGRPPLGSAWVG